VIPMHARTHARTHLQVDKGRNVCCQPWSRPVSDHSVGLLPCCWSSLLALFVLLDGIGTFSSVRIRMDNSSCFPRERRMIVLLLQVSLFILVGVEIDHGEARIWSIVEFSQGGLE